jgi:electron transport complex protein RnfG
MPRKKAEKTEPIEVIESVEPVEQTESAVPAEAEVEVYETTDAILREAGTDKPVKPPREGIGGMIKIAASLFLICAVVAAVVSFVNSITEDIIAEAQAREQQEAIARIFGESEITPIDAPEGTNALYAIGGGEIGYCVSLDAKGFGGKIGMMVGVGADGAICGVEIVSHSETPGFGAKADDPDYLGQYITHGSGLSLGKEIDAISGATISSKAVLGGVNAATAALVEAGLVPEYHKPEPEPEPTEEELWEAELAELLKELEAELESGGESEE